MRIALIGCGKQAEKHISGLRAAGIEDIVIADSNIDAAISLSEAQQLPVKSVEDAISDPEVKAVDICTPTSSHADLIRMSVANNKDWICEKPLCNTLAEAQELERITSERNLIGMVGFIYRFAPAFEEASRVFSSDRHSDVLGNINSVSFRIGGRGGHRLWKHLKCERGGAINEMLVHMLDLAIWYFGKVISVEINDLDLRRPIREVEGIEQSVDAEDYVTLKVQTESGILINLQADLITPAFTQFMEVQGDNGSFFGSIQKEFPNYVYLISPAGGYKPGYNQIEFVTSRLFDVQMRAFVRAISSRNAPCRSTVADSVKVMEAMQLIKDACEAR
ncbi:Gfo/Idh/MocA family protein [Sneathiella limimaris]|uniref:Gfo/Idh/MocA family protein n=1 Tax=Sneathiella limimaris TaxID=1964213 RepID=UPI00146A88B9|nr:Gfo/Idh/MocA family oxidoreductase [Sneathiella limimaris]